MPLENNDGSVLITRSGRTLHNDIADFVGFGFYAVLSGKFKQEFTNLFLMAGGTWNFCNFIETFPNQFRFKVFYFHNQYSV